MSLEWTLLSYLLVSDLWNICPSHHQYATKSFWVANINGKNLASIIWYILRQTINSSVTSLSSLQSRLRVAPRTNAYIRRSSTREYTGIRAKDTHLSSWLGLLVQSSTERPGYGTCNYVGTVCNRRREGGWASEWKEMREERRVVLPSASIPSPIFLRSAELQYWKLVRNNTGTILLLYYNILLDLGLLRM